MVSLKGNVALADISHGGTLRPPWHPANERELPVRPVGGKMAGHARVAELAEVMLMPELRGAARRCFTTQIPMT